MSELESRLREALRSHAEDAPPATGLAAAARTRAARRRRSRTILLAAVVAFAVGVPAGVAAFTAGGDGGPTRTPSSDASIAKDVSTGPPAPRSGYRWETYHTVELQVPDDWVDGSLSDWCAVPGSTRPRIERPETVAARIACTPASTYGVRLEPRPDYVIGNEAEVTQPHSAPWPDDAWVARKVVGDVQVTVAAPDRGTAREVVGSARTFEGYDAYGCPTDGGTSSRAPATDQLAICRYDGQSELSSSDLLTGRDAMAAVTALDAATAPARCGIPVDAFPAELRLRTASRSWFIYLGDCTVITRDDQPTSGYAMTDAVRRWVQP